MLSKSKELDEAYELELALIPKRFIWECPYFNQNKEEPKTLFAWAMWIVVGKSEELKEVYGLELALYQKDSFTKVLGSTKMKKRKRHYLLRPFEQCQANQKNWRKCMD